MTSKDNGPYASVFEPSEAFRVEMDYCAHGPDSRRHLVRLAETEPTTLVCLHGSAWRGDGGALPRALADRIAPG
jgi:mannose-6-phosphate isomerase-like protein (cupin superfamily)